MTENELHGVADDGKTQYGAQLGAFCCYCTLNMSRDRLVTIVSGILRVPRNGDAVGRHGLGVSPTKGIFRLHLVNKP